ncbi:hypothetical protein M1N05_00430 [Dehalococcoidales bacterium]|nr:hypothetical protein [Dehalococcoidales bacterium]
MSFIREAKSLLDSLLAFFLITRGRIIFEGALLKARVDTSANGLKLSNMQVSPLRPKMSLDAIRVSEPSFIILEVFVHQDQKCLIEFKT